MKFSKSCDFIKNFRSFAISEKIFEILRFQRKFSKFRDFIENVRNMSFYRFVFFKYMIFFNIQRQLCIGNCWIFFFFFVNFSVWWSFNVSYCLNPISCTLGYINHQHLKNFYISFLLSSGKFEKNTKIFNKIQPVCSKTKTFQIVYAVSFKLAKQKLLNDFSKF